MAKMIDGDRYALPVAKKQIFADTRVMSGIQRLPPETRQSPTGPSCAALYNNPAVHGAASSLTVFLCPFYVSRMEAQAPASIAEAG